jgi:hypothetical protein
MKMKDNMLKTLDRESYLNKAGKKGKRVKGVKEQKFLETPDPKFAQGGVITFQNNEENDESLKAPRSNDVTNEIMIGSNDRDQNIDENVYSDEVYSDSNSDPQKLQNRSRIKVLESHNEDNN